MAVIQQAPHEDLPPPVTQTGIVGWLRQNLFSNWLNSLLTLLAIFILWKTVVPLVEWAFIKADWIGDSRDDCDSGGACWVFVSVRFKQFMYGLYPEAEQWRINLLAILFVLLMIPMFIKSFPWKKWLGMFILFGFPIVGFYLLQVVPSSLK